MTLAISLLSFMADSGPKGKTLVQSLKISMGIQYLSFFNNHLKIMEDLKNEVFHTPETNTK